MNLICLPPIRGHRFRFVFSFLFFVIGVNAFTVLQPAPVAAQQDISQRPLEHKDYDRWNSLGRSMISNDGKWVSYSITSGDPDGDTILKFRQSQGGKEYVIDRGTSARFSFDSRFAIYRVATDAKLLKKLRKEKAKPDSIPKPTLQILDLKTGKLSTIDRVKSFAMPEKSSRWLAIHQTEPIGADELKNKRATVSESYEVTPKGLRRPAKKLKLKKRELLEEQEIEVIEEEAEETSEGESKKKGSADSKKESDGDKDAKEKKPGTMLVLRNLETSEERSFPNVTSFRFSKFGDSLTFATSVELDDEAKKKQGKLRKEAVQKAAKEESEEETEAKATSEKRKAKKAAKKKRAKKKKKSDDDAEDEEENDGEKEAGLDGVFVFDLKTMSLTQVLQATGNFRQLTFNDDATALAFVSDSDDYEAESPSWSLYLWTAKQESAAKVAAEKSVGIPKGWWLSESASLVFTEDSRRLVFSTAPVPESVDEEREKAAKGKDGKTDEDDEPKAKLDIWHWQDPQLQPQQLLQAQRERSRSYRAIYDLNEKKIIQLGTIQTPSVSVDRRSESDLLIANSNHKYRKMMSWDIQAFQDTYFINLSTGERELVREQVRDSARLSPAGKFATWFDAEETKWYAMSTEGSREPVEISAGIKFPLQNELHDTPSLPRPYGAAGWLADDEAFLVYDRFDIWQLDPTGETEPICLTESFGRENKIRFRYLRLDPEERAIDAGEALVLSAFDETSKASGFYQMTLADEEDAVGEESAEDDGEAEDDESENSEGEADRSDVEAGLKQLIMLDESVTGLRKAQDSNDVMFTRSTFRQSPDLWSSSLDFKKIHRLSDANPQQDEYTWGDVEIVNWKSDSEEELSGLLYKPDGFDESKKYPLMVYFYERNSDNLHRYYAPAAGRSIINFSFYVSRGYVIFVPDIPYETGEPGPSAESAILPGVESIVKMGFIDEDKIGMQGHSWGGYQTAYLVTQTDMFACAESGAPVSNMTSAYGGIRWGTGMSRMFQYERTQSRIGETLWQARDKYIANSPLFHADKINTPLLILHNDEDGAVPWYQGIELFVALRRLEKPAWLLNYNEQPHWVMKDENRMDFAIRMQQFFDHYLMDAPEPEWMAVGVPAVDKGKKFGLELLEPEEEREESEAEEESGSEQAGETSEE